MKPDPTQSAPIGPPSDADVQRLTEDAEDALAEILDSLEHDRPVTGKEMRKALCVINDLQALRLYSYMSKLEHLLTSHGIVDTDPYEHKE